MASCSVIYFFKVVSFQVTFVVTNLLSLYFNRHLTDRQPLTDLFFIFWRIQIYIQHFFLNKNRPTAGNILVFSSRLPIVRH